MHIARLFQVVDRRDVGMIQRGQQPRLALKTGEPFGIFCEGLRKDFDRHIALQLRVMGPINFAHAARADAREDRVLSQLRAILQ